MSKNTRNRILLTAVAALLLVVVAVGGTLAWLQDDTTAITNTFTDSALDIELDEEQDTDDNRAESFKMVPGADIAKRPFVKVATGSEACYVYVVITETGSITVNGTTYTFDDYLSYAIASGWTIVEGTKKPNATDATKSNDTYVIGRAVNTTEMGTEINILDGNEVTVNSTVTKAMMDALNADNYPTLKFQAYAIQSANLTDGTNTINDVTAAWALAKPASN